MRLRYVFFAVFVLFVARFINPATSLHFSPDITDPA